MEWIERLGADPFVVGNVGSGTVKETADRWEYVSHPEGARWRTSGRRTGTRPVQRTGPNAVHTAELGRAKLPGGTLTVELPSRSVVLLELR